MIRLLSFTEYMRPVIEEARQQCQAALAVLATKPSNPLIDHYRSTLARRVEEYEKFLNT